MVTYVVVRTRRSNIKNKIDASMHGRFTVPNLLYNHKLVGVAAALSGQGIKSVGRYIYSVFITS